MKSRLVVTVLLACATGCVPDPKLDPCREPQGGGMECDADANGLDADVGSARDGGADGQSDADASPQPRIDAGPGVNLDATVLLDAGLRDGSRPRPDASPATPGEPRVLPLEGDLGVHDPSIIEANGAFFIFSTGRGLPIKRSDDLLSWSEAGKVFATNPSWIAGEVAGVTDLWAPDIAYYNGQYHLYYSASTFGSRNSCIGHAVSADLSAGSFVDQGPVVCTEQTDDHNAIDPAFVQDDNGTAWLSFGSFWSGIKLIRLDTAGGRAGTDMFALASRDTVEAVEAPYIVRRDGYYYLFVSFDLCCRGAASTYRIVVGRAEDITGPYYDADGKPMLAQGGGSAVVLGNQRWRGPGHNTVLSVGAEQYLVYHSYDANSGGAPTLRIADLFWNSSGWPVQVGP